MRNPQAAAYDVDYLSYTCNFLKRSRIQSSNFESSVEKALTFFCFPFLFIIHTYKTSGQQSLDLVARTDFKHVNLIGNVALNISSNNISKEDYGAENLHLPERRGAIKTDKSQGSCLSVHSTDPDNASHRMDCVLGLTRSQ